MSVLYDRSVGWRGLVVGTGNKTESLIGYTTLFGDSACAFNPVGDLYKSQVRQLSADIGVPEAIIRKAPSADLWPGQTDETEAGFTYPSSTGCCSGGSTSGGRSTSGRDGLRSGPGRAGGPDGRWRRVQAPGPADREARAADRRASTTCTRVAGRARPRRAERGSDAARHAVRRRDADREPRRRHAAGPRGPARRPADRGRGHAGDAPARSTATRSRARTVSYHARSGPARERELLAHLAGGADLALVTDAGTPVVSDPGEGLVAAWAAAGGTVVPIPGASSVLAAVAGSGVTGPRWSFEGFLPRSGRERRERLRGGR